MAKWIKGAVLVATAIFVGQVLWRPAPAQPAGTTAPTFALEDLDGRRVDLASTRGKVTVVNFWATWCPPCKAELPDLAAVYRAHEKDCFAMLGVAEESGSRSDVAQFAKQIGIPYPVLLDGEGQAAQQYDVDSYPRTVVIDPSGHVQKTFRGAIRRETLEDVLRPLLVSAQATCRA